MAGDLCGPRAFMQQRVEGNHRESNLSVQRLVWVHRQGPLDQCLGSLILYCVRDYQGFLTWSISCINICFSLTATLELGSSTISVCKSLGFFEGNFKFIRRSNEHLNTQFTVQFITWGLNGKKFPNLLPYLAAGRKMIIHC